MIGRSDWFYRRDEFREIYLTIPELNECRFVERDPFGDCRQVGWRELAFDQAWRRTDTHDGGATDIHPVVVIRGDLHPCIMTRATLLAYPNDHGQAGRPRIQIRHLIQLVRFSITPRGVGPGRSRGSTGQETKSHQAPPGTQ